MKLVTITIRMAFLDAEERSAEAVADSRVRYCSDGLSAEVCFTTRRTEGRLAHPDPDFESNDGIDDWQERARAALERTDDAELV